MGSRVGRRCAVALMVVLTPMILVAGCKGDSSKSATSSTAAVSSQAAASGSQESGSASDCPTSNTTSFAKTKFVAHAGLGFGAFHRYLYKPYKAGTFKKGADGRITAFVKGGAAALFIKREIRLASEDVKANPTLCKAIAAPLSKIGDSVQDAVDKAKSGDFNGLESVNAAIGSVTGKAKDNGVDVKEDDNPNIASTPK